MSVSIEKVAPDGSTLEEYNSNSAQSKRAYNEEQSANALQRYTILQKELARAEALNDKDKVRRLESEMNDLLAYVPSKAETYTRPESKTPVEGEDYISKPSEPMSMAPVNKEIPKGEDMLNPEPEADFSKMSADWKRKWMPGSKDNDVKPTFDYEGRYKDLGIEQAKQKADAARAAFMGAADTIKGARTFDQANYVEDPAWIKPLMSYNKDHVDLKPTVKKDLLAAKQYYDSNGTGNPKFDVYKDIYDNIQKLKEEGAQLSPGQNLFDTYWSNNQVDVSVKTLKEKNPELHAAWSEANDAYKALTKQLDSELAKFNREQRGRHADYGFGTDQFGNRTIIMKVSGEGKNVSYFGQVEKDEEGNPVKLVWTQALMRNASADAKLKKEDRLDPSKYVPATSRTMGGIIGEYDIDPNNYNESFGNAVHDFLLKAETNTGELKASAKGAYMARNNILDESERTRIGEAIDGLTIQQAVDKLNDFDMSGKLPGDVFMRNFVNVRQNADPGTVQLDRIAMLSSVLGAKIGSKTGKIYFKSTPPEDDPPFATMTNERQAELSSMALTERNKAGQAKAIAGQQGYSIDPETGKAVHQLGDDNTRVLMTDTGTVRTSNYADLVTLSAIERELNRLSKLEDSTDNEQVLKNVAEKREKLLQKQLQIQDAMRRVTTDDWKVWYKAKGKEGQYREMTDKERERILNIYQKATGEASGHKSYGKTKSGNASHLDQDALHRVEARQLKDYTTEEKKKPSLVSQSGKAATEEKQKKAKAKAASLDAEDF